MATSRDVSIELSAKVGGIKKGLKQAATTVDKHYKNLTTAQKEQAGKISKIKKELMGHEDKLIRQSVAQHEKQMRKELANVKKGSQEEYQIKKNFLQKIEGLYKQLTKSVEKENDKIVADTAKTGKDIGKGGKLTGALTEEVGALGEQYSSMTGRLGSVLGKLGPYGIAAGAAVGATIGLGKAAYEATQKFNEYNDVLNKMNQNTSLTTGEIDKLRLQLLEIPRPAGMAASEIAEIATTVSYFAESADEIPKVTKNIVDLVAAYPDANPVEVTMGMQRLTTQLGDADKAFNVLAAQAEMMKGKSLDPLGEASTELGTVFTKASVAVDNTGVAMQRAQQLFGAFLGTGYEVGESTSTAEMAFEGLAMAMKDTGAVEKMNQAMRSTGKTLEDVGLKTGDIDPAKLLDYFRSGEEGSQELKAALGGSIDGLLLLDATLQKNGETLADYKVDVEGAGERVADLRTESQKANDELAQNFDNLMINLGSQTEGLITDITAGIASALGAVASFFEPASVTFDKAILKTEEYNDTIKDLNMVLENPSPNTEAQLERINAILPEIAEIEPFVADEIKRIQGNDDMTTEERLTAINELLEGTVTLAENLRDAAAFEAMESAGEKMIDVLQENASWYDYLLSTDHIYGASDTFSKISGYVKDQSKLVDNLAGKMERMDKSSQEYADTLKEWATQSKELVRLKGIQSTIDEALVELTDDALKAITLLNDGNIENVELEEAYALALSNSNEYLATNVDYQNQLRDALAQTLAQKQSEVATQQILNAALLNELKMSGQITFAETATKDEKLKTLKVMKEELEVQKVLAENAIEVAKIMGMTTEEIAKAESRYNTIANSIAVVDEQVSQLGVTAQTVAEETKAMGDEQKKAADKLIALTRQVEDAKFEAAWVGADEGEKAFAEEERRYRRHLEDIRAEFGENREMIEAAEAIHQANMVKLEKESQDAIAEGQKKAMEERQKRNEEERRKREQAAEEARRKAEERRRAEAEAHKQALEEQRKRQEDYNNLMLDMALEQAGKVGELQERLAIVQEAKAAYRIARLAGESTTPIIEDMKKRIEELSLDPLTGALERNQTQFERSVNAYNDALQKLGLTGEWFDKYSISLEDINDSMQDVPVDVWAAKQRSIIDATDVTLQALDDQYDAFKRNREEMGLVSEEDIKQAQEYYDKLIQFHTNTEEYMTEKSKEEIQRRRSSYRYSFAIDPESRTAKQDLQRLIDAQQKAEYDFEQYTKDIQSFLLENMEIATSLGYTEKDILDIKIEQKYQMEEMNEKINEYRSLQYEIAHADEKNAETKAKALFMDEFMLANRLRYIDILQTQEELQIRQDHLLDSSGEKEMMLIDLQMRMNEQRIIELQSMEDSESVQLRILELQEANLSLEEQRIQRIRDEKAARQSAIKDLEALRKKMVSLDMDTYEQERQAIEDNAEAEIEEARRIIEERLKLLEHGSDEYLALQKERVEIEARIEREKEEQLQELKKKHAAETIIMITDYGRKLYDFVKQFGSMIDTLKSDTASVGEQIQSITSTISDIASQFGIVGQAVGGIIDFFGDLFSQEDEQEEARAEAEERRRKHMEYINKLFDTQLKYMQDLIDSQSELMDTTEEQIDYLENMKEVFIDTANIAARFVGWLTNVDYPALQGYIEYIKQTYTDVTDLETASLEDLYAIRQWYQDEQLRMLEEGNEQSAKLYQDDIDKINQLIEMNKQLLALEKQAFEDRLSYSESQMALGGRQQDDLEEQIRIYSDMLTATSDITGGLLYTDEERADIMDRQNQAQRELFEMNKTIGFQLYELNGISKDSLTYKQDMIKWIDREIAMADDLGLTEIEINELLLEKMGLEQDIRDIMKEQKEISQDVTRELGEQIALRANDYKAFLQMSRHELRKSKNAVIEALGLGDMTTPELFDYITDLGYKAINRLDDETKKLISTWLSNWEDFSDAALDDAENLIELREEAGVISEEEANQALLELYKEEYDRLVAINATEEEQLEMLAKIRDIEKEINGELSDQDEAQARLAKLVRERQKAMEAMRAGGTAAAVSEADKRIRAELLAQGMSDAEIAKFMATLPQRQEGGLVDEGPAYLHNDEFVMSAVAVAKYGAAFFDKLNNLQIPAPASTAMRHLTAAAMTNNSTQNITIQVFVDNEWNNQGLGTELASTISSQQKEALYDAINQGIQSRRINLLSGGRV